MVAATVERTWAASGWSGCPGRATTQRRTRTRSSRMRMRDRRTAEPASPGRAAASDAGDAGHLEGGEPDELADDAPADGHFRSAHIVPPRSATAGMAPAPRSAASESAMSAGTRVRAVVAATSQP